MKAIIYLCLCCISLSAAAQYHREKFKRGDYKKGEFLPLITRSIGGSFQKFDGLNSRVASLPQYKTLKDYAGTLGLGWFKEMHSFISEAGVTIGSSMSGHRDEKSSTIRYISLNMDLGYDVLNSRKVTLYPLIGLGFQKYQAIFYKDNSGVDFNTVLSSPVVENSISSVRFNNGFFVYRAGFGVAFKSPKYPSNSIGLQAGYTGSFKKNDWRSNENQVLNNSPVDRISQFYVTLVLTSRPWMMMK